VAEELIPELQAEGERLAAEDLDSLADHQLADALEQRQEAIARWKKIYWDEFIPLAHGVRRLATYYNDAVQPDDPYEFVALLQNQPLVALQRNRALGELARQLSDNPALRSHVASLLEEARGNVPWSVWREKLLGGSEEAASFVQAFDQLNGRYLDIAFDQQRLSDQADSLLRNLLELSGDAGPSPDAAVNRGVEASQLEDRLLASVGPERRQEALEVLETGRVSWKLRDDDNLLVARLESQQLRAVEVAANRLRRAELLVGEGRADASHAESLVRVLRDPASGPITIEAVPEPRQVAAGPANDGESPRQLVGQPASPGVATGVVHIIRGRDDLGAFRSGAILVCDAIQPTMTHLVPLASAIIERRGGMLIHGAIIARELGIPCVNGVRQAADLLRNGDVVTVDGHLGIVTVGTAGFDLEMQFAE
jgi:pyruvate,water dikinase